VSFYGKNVYNGSKEKLVESSFKIVCARLFRVHFKTLILLRNILSNLIKKIYKKFIINLFKFIYDNVQFDKKISLNSYYVKKIKINKILYFIYKIQDGRVYSDQVSNVAYIKNNHILEGPSIQLRNGIIVRSNKNTVLKSGTPRLINNVTGKILSLLSGGAGNYNYWHWLFDVIPRIFLYEKFYLLKNINKIIVPDIKEKFQYQTLILLGIKIKNCINSQVCRHIKFNELYVTSHPNLNSKLEKIPNWIILSLKKKFLKKKFLTSLFPTFKNIYIDRSDSKSNVRNFRKIINEELIKIFLASRGFKIIRLSEYSFIEQVNIFYNANCIIGLHGAGFANIVFCKKKAVILEIKSNTTGDIIKNLAIFNKLKYIGISLNPRFKPIGSQFGIVYLPLIKLKFLMIRNGIY
jgi:hypothetical protein